jgi:hypothetical protein
MSGRDNFLRDVPWTRQPQIPVGINPRFAAATKLLILPGLGWHNLALFGEVAQSNAAIPLSSTPSGRTFEFDGTTTYAEYGPILDAAAGDLTLIAILRANSAQYLGADGDRYLVSSRTAGNAGFAWGLNAATGGGAGGNVTAQTLVLNGVAAYTEASYTIESFVDTPVAFRYVKSTGTISWFRFGSKSSADTAGSTSPTTGSNLNVGQLGPYAGSNRFKHRAHVIVGMQRALSDSEIHDLTSSVPSVWQLFAPLPRRIFVGPSAGGAYTLTADAGTFNKTGTDATLAFNRVVGASAGAFALTGTDASLQYGRTLTAAAGTFNLTGTDATLAYNRVLTAAAGAYALTGTDASLVYTPAGGGTTYTLTADTVAFSLTGTAATLAYNRVVTAAAGSYALSGTAATLTRGFNMTATGGAYTFTGTDATFNRTYVLASSAGAYTFTGTAATLTYSAAAVVIDYGDADFVMRFSGGSTQRIGPSISGASGQKIRH